MKTLPRKLLPIALLLLMPASLHALEISGSSTVQPVVDRLIPLYTEQGGEAVGLAGGGSGAGIKDAIGGKSQIGMVSRELKDDESTRLKNTVIGIDALAIIINRKNPLGGLTKAQLTDLYLGKVRNWKELGGPDLRVALVSKEVGRSTLELFEHYTGLASPERDQPGKPRISADAYVIGSNLEALTLVGGIAGAIGYVSVGAARALEKAGMPIRIIPLDGVPPTDDAIRGRRYPIIRPLNLVYVEEHPSISAFLAVALSPRGQDIVTSLGFLSVGR